MTMSRIMIVEDEISIALELEELLVSHGCEVTGVASKGLEAVSILSKACLPRLVGRTKALDMILFSKTIDAREALKIGLVNRVSAPGKLTDDALEFAQKLAERPPIAVSCVLKAMAAGEYDGLEKGLHVEAEGNVRVRETKDRIEGFNAFLEKRKPLFTGE